VSRFVPWRIEPLASPAWIHPCPGCARPARFACAERFRVNAQQGRLDVWLLYHCSACGRTAKRRLQRRRPVASFAPGRLAGYLANDPLLARAHAFEIASDGPLPHRVVRPPLPGAGVLRARVEQPLACGLRWDRLLALELGASRAQVQRAWRCGRLRVEGVSSPARPVRDGQLLTAVIASTPSREAP